MKTGGKIPPSTFLLRLNGGDMPCRKFSNPHPASPRQESFLWKVNNFLWTGMKVGVGWQLIRWLVRFRFAVHSFWSRMAGLWTLSITLHYQ
jgi:hypothetical protein